jgi:hypothetical protein
MLRNTMREQHSRQAGSTSDFITKSVIASFLQRISAVQDSKFWTEVVAGIKERFGPCAVDEKQMGALNLAEQVNKPRVLQQLIRNVTASCGIRLSTSCDQELSSMAELKNLKSAFSLSLVDIEEVGVRAKYMR